jgi:hypothetical protein
VNEWRRHAGGGAERSKSSTSKSKRRASDDNSSVSSTTLNSLGLERAFPKITVPPANFLKKALKEIVVEDLSEPLLPIIGAKKFAVLLHNVLTPEECSELIDRAEENGFEDASIYDGRTNRAHRNCTRYVTDDINLVENWFERIVHALTGTAFEKKLMRKNHWINHTEAEVS